MYRTGVMYVYSPFISHAPPVSLLVLTGRPHQSKKVLCRCRVTRLTTIVSRSFRALS